MADRNPHHIPKSNGNPTLLLMLTHNNGKEELSNLQSLTLTITLNTDPNQLLPKLKESIGTSKL